MNHKYILSCIPGRMMRTGEHILRLDTWEPGPGELVLASGTMSHSEYEKILVDRFCYLYTIKSCNWIGIYNPRVSSKYYIPNPTDLAVGFLRKTGYNVYRGHVRTIDIY